MCAALQAVVDRVEVRHRILTVVRAAKRYGTTEVPRIEAAIKEYRYANAGDYLIWPGPNSNTFIATVLRAVPELGVTLPPNAVGRDFRPLPYLGLTDSGTRVGAQQYFDWFKYEFWRFVFVQQRVEKLAMTAVEFPPMQKGASFNLDAVKAKIEAARTAMGK